MIKVDHEDTLHRPRAPAALLSPRDFRLYSRIFCDLPPRLRQFPRVRNGSEGKDRPFYPPTAHSPCSLESWKSALRQKTIAVILVVWKFSEKKVVRCFWVQCALRYALLLLILNISETDISVCPSLHQPGAPETAAVWKGPLWYRALEACKHRTPTHRHKQVVACTAMKDHIDS